VSKRITIGGAAVATIGYESDLFAALLEDRVADATLAETGGASVDSIERDDDIGVGWEVEIAKLAGSWVEVYLDDHLDVVWIGPEAVFDD
jgi:hypothetical protein